MRLSYRKFAFLLLFLATMVLAVAWLGSLRTWRECTVVAQPFTFHFSLRSGTAGVMAASYGASGYGIQPTSYQVANTGADRQAVSVYRPQGRFRVDREAIPLHGAAGHHTYVLEIPVWFPYLLFMAGTLMWMKVRSRQTDAATERAMALRCEEERMGVGG